MNGRELGVCARAHGVKRLKNKTFHDSLTKFVEVRILHDAPPARDLETPRAARSAV